MNDTDPLADLLRRLTTEQWHADAHQSHLLARVQAARTPRRRRLQVLLAFAAGTVLTVSTLAATGGFAAMRRWFGIEIVDVRRDGRGEITGITMRTEDGAELDLQPVGPGHEFTDPPVVALPRVGGGQVRLRVLRPGDLDLLETYETHPVVDGAPRPEAGEPLAARHVPKVLPTAVLHDDRLELRGPGRMPRVLPRVPAADAPPRYGDADGLVEIVP